MTSVTDRLLAGRYRLGTVLGQGGMAHVYEGFDERLQRTVAVKVLRGEVASQRPEVRARFEAEARSAAGLTHPNVVAVFDTGEDEGLPFIVMERLPGDTLADRMAAGPADLDWLRRVAGDVLGALAAAHAAGIVHRDIKPANILIGGDGCAKVADFGIAKSLEGQGADLTGANVLVGTPAYMAPERVRGEPATVPSDLYSLGVVLYEGVAGRKPFSGATPVALAYAIQQGDADPLPELRPEVDRGFAAVIDQAMAVDPARRFASATAMANALGVAPGTDPTVATTTTDGSVDATMTAGPAVLLEPAVARPMRLRWPSIAPRWLWAAAVAIFVIALLAFAAAGSGGNNGTAPPATAVTSRVAVTRAPATTTAPRAEAPAPQRHAKHAGGKHG